jgi:hypothetical protein
MDRLLILTPCQRERSKEEQLEWRSFEKRHYCAPAAHEHTYQNSSAYPNVPVSLNRVGLSPGWLPATGVNENARETLRFVRLDQIWRNQ